jgi:hypothetical protein
MFQSITARLFFAFVGFWPGRFPSVSLIRGDLLESGHLGGSQREKSGFDGKHLLRSIESGSECDSSGRLFLPGENRRAEPPHLRRLANQSHPPNYQRHLDDEISVPTERMGTLDSACDLR